jgi:plastocyanin
MHVKASLASATLVLLAGLALIAAPGFPSPASAGRPANSESVKAKVFTVVIHEFEFEPATLSVHAGDTVEWKNDDIVPHTATADSDAQKPVFDSGTIDTGATWRYVVRKKGTYNYGCTLHPNMKGKLIVQ